MLNDTLNKITRLMFILGEFDKGSVNLSATARVLGVTTRTVQRDIRILESAGFPIANISRGEYCFVEGYTLDKLHLSAKEAALLAFLGSIAGSLGGSFKETYLSLRDRILEKDSNNPFYIKLPKGQAFFNNANIKTIEQAVKKREKLKIEYQNSRISGREISPLKIAWYDGFWYLLALGDNNLILKLRLDKIKELKKTGNTFKMPKSMDKILEESASIWFEDKRDKRVELKISPQAAPYFEKREYFPRQKIIRKTNNGELRLECFTGKYEEILPVVLRWLPHIVAVTPEEFKNKIKEVVSAYEEKINKS